MNLLKRNSGISKRFACIENHKHEIKLKQGTEQVCLSSRKRSPIEEELELQCISKLVELGILEQAVSAWAGNEVVVPRKDKRTRVTTDFGAINNITVTDAFSMENVQLTNDWLPSKNVFSTFDLMDGFY